MYLLIPLANHPRAECTSLAFFRDYTARQSSAGGMYSKVGVAFLPWRWLSALHHQQRSIAMYLHGSSIPNIHLMLCTKGPRIALPGQAYSYVLLARAVCSGVEAEGMRRTPAAGFFCGSKARGESGSATRWNLLNSARQGHDQR